ncbi:MAG: dTDP-glucose 4,6-dehydratase, partial [Candidatus Limnocylindrales bacterium]
MRILICGGAGFIGSHFVQRRLASTTDELVVLDKLTYAGGRDTLAAAIADCPDGAARVTFVEGDIADPDVVGPLVAEADAVVNFAAETHVDRSILDSEPVLRSNVFGVQVLLSAIQAAGPDGLHRRLVQVSTDEVYGPRETGLQRETDPLSPRSPYAATKAAGDLLALAHHATYGLDVVITRGANTYGPRQHPEKLVPLFVTNALVGKELPLYGDGLQVRDWLHVRDHAAAVCTALDRGVAGTVYNVPGGQERTNREVTGAILERLRLAWDRVRYIDDRPGHDRRYAMDGARMAELGWRPLIALDDGLTETVDWYSTHR